MTERITLPEPSASLCKCPHCGAEMKIDAKWYARLQQVVAALPGSESAAAVTAEAVTYDNTDSGLTAADVQAAVDEVEGRVDTLEGGAGAVVTAITAASITAGATEVDIALGSHDMVEIDLIAIEPSDDGVGLEMRFSQDGGANYLSGASDYAFGFVVAGLASVDNADSEIRVTGLIGNSTDERATTTLRIFRPAASSFAKTATFSGGGRNAAGAHEEAVGWGQLLANADPITHVRFFWSAGTFDAGHYAARGYSFS